MTYADQFNRSAEDLTAEFQARLDQSRQHAASLSQATMNRVKEISDRKDLTPEAKRTAAARVHLDARAKLNAMLAEEQKTIDTQRRNLERRLFGQAGTADPTTAVSRRDAADRAARIEQPGEALDLLRRAERGGDEHLAQALAARAAENGWGPVLDHYAASRPKAATVIEQMRALPDTDQPGYKFFQVAAYDVPAVGVLGSLPAHQISRAAAEDLDVA